MLDFEPCYLNVYTTTDKTLYVVWLRSQDGLQGSVSPICHKSIFFLNGLSVVWIICAVEGLCFPCTPPLA